MSGGRYERVNARAAPILPGQPAGRSSKVQPVALLVVASAVAVSPPWRPESSSRPLSVSRVPMRPLPEPVDVARTVSPGGASQAVVALPLSDQYDTRDAPTALLTSGVLCVASTFGSTEEATAATGSVGSVPRYAARVSATLV